MTVNQHSKRKLMSELKAYCLERAGAPDVAKAVALVASLGTLLVVAALGKGVGEAIFEVVKVLVEALLLLLPAR